MRRTAVTIGILVLLVTAAQTAAQAVSTDLAHGSFSVVCFYSHSAHDDPIVFPGSSGVSHMHNFYGSRTANAYSTDASMRASATKCRLQDDTAGYWAPAGYLSGVRLPGTRVKAHYRIFSSANRVQTFP